MQVLVTNDPSSDGGVHNRVVSQQLSISEALLALFMGPAEFRLIEMSEASQLAALESLKGYIERVCNNILFFFLFSPLVLCSFLFLSVIIGYTNSSTHCYKWLQNTNLNRP